MIELGESMKITKKKKLKPKTKNLLIFITCIFLIITSIFYGTSIFKNSEKKNTSKKVKELKDTKNNTKLKQLKNIDKKINYFDHKKIDRYLAYQKENKDLKIEKVITDVNIGIDNPYYTNTKETKYLNESYILVNKYNYLTKDYIPDNLEKINTQYARSGMQLINYAKEAFENLAKAAQKENLSIIAMSSYRSYKYQENLYNRYVQSDGKEDADTYSGRPGFSEHQTGLAVDVYNGKEDYTNFEKTKEFQWMQENAHKYGFILRFPKDKTNETGYQYESWHYRYVGTEIANYIHKNNLCYEEYYVQKIENKK